MASLLYVGVRPELDAATAERASFRVALGVDAEVLDRVDLTTTALPDDVFDRYAGFVIGGSPFNVAVGLARLSSSPTAGRSFCSPAPLRTRPPAASYACARPAATASRSNWTTTAPRRSTKSLPASCA